MNGKEQELVVNFFGFQIIPDINYRLYQDVTTIFHHKLTSDISIKTYKSFDLKIRIEQFQNGSSTRISLLNHLYKTFYIFKHPNINSLRYFLENKKEFFDINYCYHLYDRLRKFNIISEILSDFIDKVTVFKVFKEYQDSKWGGVDKDNTFTTYRQYEYVIIYKSELVIDNYLRSLLPNVSPVIIDEYEDYKSCTSTKPDLYFHEPLTDLEYQRFINSYRFLDHSNYLNNLILNEEFQN